MNYMKIYTDGSWFRDRCLAGWAFVQIVGEEAVYVKSGRLYGKYVTNVDSELYAAMKAIEYAQLKQAKVLELCHDYTGVREFALGKSRPRNENVKRYVEVYRQAVESGTCIKFTKVDKSDRCNLIADALARGEGSRAARLMRTRVCQV